MLRLELPKLRASYHVRHWAPSRWIGDKHSLPRIQYRGGLGHEVHAAEHYHVRFDLSRAPRELQRIASEVGGLLHLGAAVVVREDYGVAVLLELRDLFDKSVHGSSPRYEF